MENLLLFNNGGSLLKSGGGASLLYDAEIEYLQSDGNAYIDLGLPCSYFSPADTDFELKFIVTENRTQIICGAGDDQCQFPIVNSCLRFDWTGYIWSLSNTLSIGTLYSIVQNNGQLSCNNTSISFTRSYYTNDNFYLFAQQNSNGAVDVNTIFTGKIVSFIVKDKNTNNIRKNYVPVRKGQVGYLYETVSGQLLGNNGSGAFIIGSDKT